MKKDKFIHPYAVQRYALAGIPVRPFFSRRPRVNKYPAAKIERPVVDRRPDPHWLTWPQVLP